MLIEQPPKRLMHWKTPISMIVSMQNLTYMFIWSGNSVREAAVTLECRGTKMTATVDPRKLNNVTITDLSIKDCPKRFFNVSSNSISTTFDKCGDNVTQDNHTITHVKICSLASYFFLFPLKSCNQILT